MIMKKINSQKGLTLLETLIYVVIFSMFVVTLSSFSGSINSARLRSQTMLEVNYQGSQIIHTVTQTVRNAVSISNPVISNSGDSLTLNTDDPATNPTIFSLATGTLYIQEGLNEPIALTNNRVEINNLVFSNFSKASTPGTIKIRFNLKNADVYVKPEQQYNRDFYGSASIR